MGGNPSKVGSEQSPAIGPNPENGGKKKSFLHESEGVSAPGVATSSRLHEGPIHSLCPLGQGSILSGGVDKVYLFFMHVLVFFCISFCHSRVLCQLL